jgi:hypothetical protein
LENIPSPSTPGGEGDENIDYSNFGENMEKDKRK